MLGRIFILLLLLLSSTLTMAQAPAGISGQFTDTINRKPLAQAVVMVMRTRDSVLVKFTRTDANGRFELKALPPGNYQIEAGYPGYAAFAESLVLRDGEQKNMGPLVMLTKEKVLETVMVQQKISAIRMKGDTIEYRADSFAVGPNANVQDLLKRLPGIQVNSKGEITAQGQKVEKILVDGEEFFSDDPAVVAENLRADAVDKLQVFDKKSDQAAFSGVDDGQITRTINLELKDKAKRGYFGKAEMAGDFNQYYRMKLLANVFKAKRKIAGFFTASNTQFQVLDWDERDKYGTDPNRTVEVGDDGSMYMYSNGDNFSNGQGLPQTLSAGLMYADKWGKDKNNLNLNYQMNDQRVRGERSSLTQTILPDTSFSSRSTSTFNSQAQRHRIFGTYDYAIDSSSSLKITGKLNHQQSVAFNRFLSESISEDGRLINNSDRTTTGEDEEQTAEMTAFYRKKFAKLGRNISATLSGKTSATRYDGFLKAANNFFDKTGNPLPSLNLDQEKVSRSSQGSYNARISYVEPVWKKTYIEFSTAYAANRNDAERNTLEQSAPGKYDLRIDSLSNHFLFNTMSYSAGTTLRHNTPKLNWTLGSSLGQTRFDQEDLRLLNTRRIYFTNFLPNASIEFKPKKQRRLSISYQGRNENPSLFQIQPVIDNSDPLNITVGNPGLKQAFVHNISTRFSDYKVLKSRNIYASLTGTFTDRKIANNNSVDSQGRRITQYVNVNGVYNVNGWMSYSFEPITSVNININYNPSIGRYINLVNGQQNVTLSQSHGIGISSGFWGEKPLNYWVNAEATYNSSESSINEGLANRYWSYEFQPNITYKYKKKWIVNLDAELRLYQRTQAFANQQDFYIVNASLKRLLGKKNQFEIAVDAHDIFNQNIGFNRNISTNFISENRWQTIQRYVLLRVAYNFTKQNAQPQ